MNTIAIQDIPDHFSNDGLQSFRLQANYQTGVPVDLLGSLVEVILFNSLNVIIWEFSSESEGDNKLNILADGWVEFPRILQWNIPSTKYNYKLKATEPDGFVRTYFTGFWRVGKLGSGAGSEIRGTVLYPEKGEKGNAGWTERYTEEKYGEKVIRKLTNYSGGTGEKPNTNIGLYISFAGFTDN